MTMQLTDELASVLRVVLRLGLSEAATIANGIGRSPGSRLEDLVDAGLVTRQASRRPDKRRSTLYSITSIGQRRLVAFDDAADLRRAYGNTPTTVAATRTVHLTAAGTYTGEELRPYAGRPGAMDAFDLPSRMGSRLHYRDGRVTAVPETCREMT